MAICPVARDSATADFFDGARHGAFLLRRHRSTGEYLDPSTVPALDDEPDLEYAPASGGARVVSWSTLPSRNDDSSEPVRTVVGIVELDEGLWWWTQLVEVDPDANLADLRVQVDFIWSGPDPQHEVVPVFRPASPEHRT
jgi:uncharacterized OB-fold protein